MKKYLVTESWTEERYMEVEATNKEEALEKFAKAREDDDREIDYFCSDEEFKVKEMKE